ncbi:hypothetical protein JCM11491_005640 [Sporobolomyces phaffii]
MQGTTTASRRLEGLNLATKRHSRSPSDDDEALSLPTSLRSYDLEQSSSSSSSSSEGPSSPEEEDDDDSGSDSDSDSGVEPERTPAYYAKLDALDAWVDLRRTTRGESLTAEDELSVREFARAFIEAEEPAEVVVARSSSSSSSSRGGCDYCSGRARRHEGHRRLVEALEAYLATLVGHSHSPATVAELDPEFESNFTEFASVRRGRCRCRRPPRDSWVLPRRPPASSRHVLLHKVVVVREAFRVALGVAGVEFDPDEDNDEDEGITNRVPTFLLLKRLNQVEMMNDEDGQGEERTRWDEFNVKDDEAFFAHPSRLFVV